MFNEASQYDQLTLERTVRSLSSLGIRQSPLTWERARRWARQFAGGPEKDLAWLILRHLVFRTTDQLESSIRQALKKAAQHFGQLAELPTETKWREVLSGEAGGLNFYCSPPVASSYTTPGKSGELIARLVNRTYKIDKTYSYNISTFQPDERLLIVDDGSFTGEQLDSFLVAYEPAKRNQGKVAIVLAVAHENAICLLRNKHPSVPLFCGEVILASHCFEGMAQSWVDKKLWVHEDCSPLDIYRQICAKHNLAWGADAGLGFGGLGVMLGYEHGIPDDAIRLLWDHSETWDPLIER